MKKTLFISDILKVKKLYKWSELIESAELLAGNGYLVQLRKLHHSKEINRLTVIEEIPIIQILKGKRLDILKYFTEELHINYKLATSFYDRINECRYHKDLLTLAAEHSTLDIVKYIESIDTIEEHGNRWNYKEAFTSAPLSNNIEILKYIGAKLININQMTNNNNNDIIKIDISNNKSQYDYINNSLSFAAYSGRIDMIEWISNNFINSMNIDKNLIYKLTHYNILLSVLSGCGSLEVFQYCFETEKENTSECRLIDGAAKRNRLNILQWLHQNQIGICTKNAMDFASENGHLETIKWLHENRSEGCTTRAMDKAAENGHLETIKWLHENRTEGCTTDAMGKAAMSGHLEILKWLHENRTEGCTVFAMNMSAYKNQLEVLIWLHENTTEGCTTSAIDWAAESGNFEIVKWLHHNRTEGCTTGAMNNAAQNGHLEIVKWLHHNRTEGCTTGAMDWAAGNGFLDVLKWLYENRTEGFTREAYDEAKYGKRVEILDWLEKIM